VWPLANEIAINARAGSGQVVDGNFFLLEDVENSQVGDAASESAAERDADAGTLHGGRRRFGICEFANATDRTVQPINDRLFGTFRHGWIY
jgi:hypothetical protein